MTTFFEKLITDIPVKIISSLVFLIVVLFLFKPKIKISPFICKPPLKEGEEPYYQIKILNRSWFNAFDVKVELHLLERYSTPPTGMMNVKYETLTMKYNHIFHLPAFRYRWMRKECSHAMRLKTLENIEGILLQNGKSIEI
jgi:hypothetical protein